MIYPLAEDPHRARKSILPKFRTGET